MTEPSPKTFDLAAALSGRTFPEIVVPVFFDEALQFELATLETKIASATEGVDALEEERENLLEKFKEAVIRVKVRGTPLHLRKASIEKVMEEFPQQYTPFGQPKPNYKGDEAFSEANWILHVVEIIGPDGSVLHPSPEDIITFRSQAPDSAIEAVSVAIDSLTKGSKSGYEKAVQDLDFLSQP